MLHLYWQSIKGYLVDKEYLPALPDGRIKNGKPVLTGDLLEHDVVVALGVSASSGEIKLYEQCHIKRIYRTDIAGAFVLNRANLLDEGFLSKHCNEVFRLFDMLWYITQKFTGCLKKEYSQSPTYFDEDIFLPKENETFLTAVPITAILFLCSCQEIRFCQGVRPLLDEWGLTELYQNRT